jgi:adenylate cyclase
MNNSLYQYILGKLRFRIRVPIAIKLALSITLLIVSGMASLGYTILENQKKIMSSQVISLGTTVAGQLANSSTEMVLTDDTLGLQTLVNNLIDKETILGAAIIAEDGQILAQSGNLPGESIIQSHLANISDANQSRHFEWRWSFSPSDSHTLVTFTSPIHFKDLLAGHVLVSFTKNYMVQSLQESRQLIILVTVVMTMIAIILAFIMSKHLSKPIYSLVTASKAIGKGDFSYRLNERRNDEIGELALAFNQMADGLLKKSQVENVFSRYVSSSVAKKIMENLENIELGGKHVHASVLFADIVGFTGISENLPPEDITVLLNEFFSYISKISELHNGHIDKFMGDCVMIVFGVPEDDPDHSYNAIACAIMIQKLVARLNDLRLKNNQIAIHFRIGVNTGDMVAGNLGSHDRMDYTVIGDPVNLASRLSGIAQSDQIIILDRLYFTDNINKRILARPHETILIRGIQKPVSTYLVEDLIATDGKSIDDAINKLLENSYSDEI